MNSSNIKINLKQSKHRQPFSVLVKRGLWSFVVGPVFSRLPAPLVRIKMAILKCFGAKLEGRCYILPGAKILMPWNLCLGKGVALGRNVEIYNFSLVKIGGMSVVSQYTYLCTGSHDYTHPHFPLIHKPIEIGSECWLAARVFVGPGVRIGDGAVIGACAVVTKDVAAWTVNAGNPSRSLKKREIHA